MLELKSEEFHKVIPIFEKIDHSIPIVYALLEGNSPGRIFVDQADEPAMALLQLEGAFFYIGGDENHPALEQSIRPLIFKELLPQTIDKELVLFSFSNSWRQRLDTLLQGVGAIRIARKVFKFNPEKFIIHRNWRESVPLGFTMRAIDERLAEGYPIYKPIVDPKSKRLGVCLMEGDAIVSECSAIFVGRGEAEIDIHTQEKYQGRGFATLTASAFIEACLLRGLNPNWSCWPERQASCSLARKLGFEEQMDVPAHLWVEEFLADSQKGDHDAG